MSAFHERGLPSHFGLYEHERIYHFVSTKYGNRAKTTLDYGCGNGYGTFILSKNFNWVVGVDVDSEIIENCKIRYKAENLEFKLISLSEKPFKNNRFDFIFSFQVLEHIPIQSAESFIRNIYEMLKVGGIAIITTPNANNYFKGFSGNPFHEKEYTKAELEYLLKKTISDNEFKIYAIQDILSTKISLLIKKKMEESLISRMLARIAKKTLSLLEKTIPALYKHQKMIVKSNPEKIIGSLYVEIQKTR